MQNISKLCCKGYRGFNTDQELRLATPNGSFGSGLTVLIGPNGGGKSTLIECFRRLSNTRNVSFTEGKRNKVAGDKVSIRIEFDGHVGTLETVETGGAKTNWHCSGGENVTPSISFLPSRRVFTPYFSEGKWTRDNYFKNSSNFSNRSEPINNFSHRLFNALEKYEEFSEVFKRIYGKRLEWTIDQNDTEQYYVKITKPGNVFHNSDGMGEGLVSLLFIADAIFESTEDEILVIDEPELSLHPQLQRRLLIELCKLAEDRQILIATHSPEMISIDAISNGMEVSRVVDSVDGSVIHRLIDDCRETFSSLEKDLFNPHAFAYESRACLFAEDSLVITEGQEDVVFLNKMINDLGLDYLIPFWGFGAGGASKIQKIAKILDSLGFRNISAVFDGDKPEDLSEFRNLFPQYTCWSIPADDIRDKDDGNGNVVKEGVFDLKKRIKPQFVEQCKSLLAQIHKQVNG